MKRFVLLVIALFLFKTADAQVLEGKWYLFGKDGRGELVELVFSRDKIIANQFTVDSLGKLHDKKDDDPPLIIKHIAEIDSGRLVYVADIRSKYNPVYIPFEVRHHTRDDERVLFIPLTENKLTTVDSAISQIDSIDRRRSVLYSRSRLDEILKMKRLGDVSKETYISLLEAHNDRYKQLMDDAKRKHSKGSYDQVENIMYEAMVSLDINPFGSREYFYDIRRTMEKDPLISKTVRRIEKELNEYGK